MDNQKDINQKDTSTLASMSVPNAVATSMHNLALFQDKSLKMAAALHLVTELFSETEPIRGTLREQAVSLVLVAADRRMVESTESIDHAQYVIDTTLSLINVLNNSRLLSDMNATILITELRMLATLLGSIAIPSAKLSELVLHDLFASSVVAPQVGDTTETVQPSKTIISDFSHVPVNQSRTSTAPAVRTSPKATTPSQTHTPAVKKTNPITDKTSRRDQILACITNQGSSIKDIAQAVRGCSEKTIQRELNAMIEQGQIVREGEKRWSIYKKT